MAARSWLSPLLRVSLEGDLVAAGPRRRQPDHRHQRGEPWLVVQNVRQRSLSVGFADEDVDRRGAIGGDEGVEVHAAMIQAVGVLAVETAVAGVAERADGGRMTSTTDPRGVPLPKRVPRSIESCQEYRREKGRPKPPPSVRPPLRINGVRELARR
jgi:hypothetical protein